MPHHFIGNPWALFLREQLSHNRLAMVAVYLRLGQEDAVEPTDFKILFLMEQPRCKPLYTTVFREGPPMTVRSDYHDFEAGQLTLLGAAAIVLLIYASTLIL